MGKGDKKNEKRKKLPQELVVKTRPRKSGHQKVAAPKVEKSKELKT